ncbi:hypothetical protein ES288_D05G082700v1 [Gossypium darwinii]|uniref:Carboxypeptidase n=1 Tax=Gossypium darwinii TaxID=34276 RepID=A0A5D2CDA8_GOSDA|nr:hypothetical protein ES288_D05G082700v1 [Gossypium darwinii]
MAKPVLYSCLLFSFCLLSFLSFCEAADRQGEILHKLLMSGRSEKSRISSSRSWAAGLHGSNPSTYSPVCIEPQDGKMEADEIDALPGQPDGVDFDQYAGYVTVDQKAGRALFYYFVESPRNSLSNNPLILGLNGGPGCSSLGYGAMSELGPFRVNSDGQTLFRNDFAWNNVANVIFLESPAGVCFSFSNTSSNTSSDYDNAGDTTTAIDTYTFLVNWLERFPQYKSRDFFIAGESYAGHYVPQLASTILYNNENTNQTVINLKGIAIRSFRIKTYADFSVKILVVHVNALVFRKCFDFTGQADDEIGDIDIYNIYAPICLDSSLKNGSHGSVHDFDPCTDYYVEKIFQRYKRPSTQIRLNGPIAEIMHGQIGHLLFYLF